MGVGAPSGKGVDGIARPPYVKENDYEALTDEVDDRT